MRTRAVLLTGVFLLVLGCATAPPKKQDNPYLGSPGEDEAPMQVTFAGGDGSSCNAAVVIKGAIDTFQGIAAENTWLREHYAKGERISTKSGDCANRITDIVGIRMPDGSLKTVIFDITDFYGKW